MKQRKGLVSRLKTRIELQQPVDVSDGVGGFTTSWQKVDDLWAEVIASSGVRGKERLQFGNVAAINSYRITVRYRKEIVPDMRFVLDNEILNIRNMVDVDQTKSELRIYAEGGVPT